MPYRTETYARKAHSNQVISHDLTNSKGYRWVDALASPSTGYWVMAGRTLLSEINSPMRSIAATTKTWLPVIMHLKTGSKVINT